MKYEFSTPEGFLLKSLAFSRTEKGAPLYWAYVQTEKPEYGTYCHFQGAQSLLSMDDAIEQATRDLRRSLEARARPSGINKAGLKIDLSQLKINLSSITKGEPNA
jgi:hypothetical protein